MDNKIEINQGPVLTFNMRVGAVIILAFGVWIIFNALYSIAGLIIAVLLIGIGFSCWMMFYRFDIDPDNKTYHDYIAILSFKTGKPVKFQSVEKIYINKINQVSNFMSRGRTLDIHTSVYKAFIKFDSGEKFHLDNDPDKGRLLLRIRRYADKLETIIQDNTE